MSIYRHLGCCSDVMISFRPYPLLIAWCVTFHPCPDRRDLAIVSSRLGSSLDFRGLPGRRVSRPEDPPRIIRTSARPRHSVCRSIDQLGPAEAEPWLAELDRLSISEAAPDRSGTKERKKRGRHTEPDRHQRPRPIDPGVDTGDVRLECSVGPTACHVRLAPRSTSPRKWLRRRLTLAPFGTGANGRPRAHH